MLPVSTVKTSTLERADSASRCSSVKSCFWNCTNSSVLDSRRLSRGDRSRNSLSAAASRLPDLTRPMTASVCCSLNGQRLHLLEKLSASGRGYQRTHSVGAHLGVGNAG